MTTDTHRATDEVTAAVATLHRMWMRGIGTFPASRVAAVWQDGTLVDLAAWADVEQAFHLLARAHGWWTTGDDNADVD